MIIRRNSVFYLILLIMVMGLVSADNLPHKQITDYNLIFTADNSTSCNVSYIKFPDDSLSTFFNKPMTKNNQIFSFNITANNFSQLGTYCVYSSCTNITSSNSVCFVVTPDGTTITNAQTAIYIFFLLICLTLLYISFKMIIKNPFSKDKLAEVKEYELHKENKFMFYIHLLKKKFWIAGLFGIYMFLFLFTSILNSLVFNLGLSSLNLILIYLNDVLAWLGIPFVIFWIAYIILYFFTEVTRTLKHQFGGFRR